MTIHTNTLDKNSDTVKRQLEFPSEVYKDANDFVTEENKRLGKFSGKEKLYIKDILPKLAEYGLRFVKGEIYTPSDKQRVFMKDEKYVKLRAKAEVAMEEFRNYQNQLLSE